MRGKSVGSIFRCKKILVLVLLEIACKVRRRKGRKGMQEVPAVGRPGGFRRVTSEIMSLFR